MKIRIATALVGLPLMFVLVLVAPIWMTGAAVGFVCAGAAFEFMSCTDRGGAPPHGLLAHCIGGGDPLGLHPGGGPPGTGDMLSSGTGAV